MINIIETQGDVLRPHTYVEPRHLRSHVNVVHGCNAQGVMGAGLALQVRNQFPAAHLAYQEQLNSKQALGTISLSLCDDITIVNAITQFTMGDDKSVRYTSYDAVVKCFEAIVKKLDDLQVRGVFVDSYIFAIPKLFASDRGNADWDIVLKIIERTMGKCTKHITLYVVEYQK